MRFIKVLFLLALFVFSILFFSQNNDVLLQELTLKLDVPYLVTLYSIPCPSAFSFSPLLLQAPLLTMVYFAVDKVRSGSKLKECKTRMASLEQELNSLRNMPISEDQPYGAAEEKKEEDNQ